MAVLFPMMIMDTAHMYWGFWAAAGERPTENSAGAAPGCGLIPLKVLDKNGNGSQETVIEAMQWILKYREKYHIRIVNISVGTTRREGHEQLIEAVEEAWDAGLIVVAAAGNQGPGQGSVTAPGCSRKIITVGSSDMIVHNLGLSGRGPTKDCVSKPDIVAPGNAVTSCANFPAAFPYTVKSGTSMSTPLVSGGIALFLELHPESTNLDIKKRLRSTAIDLGYPHNLQGWGLFRLKNFLEGK